MTPEVILTEDELRELCAEYQKILRLQDWRVTVRVGRPTKQDEGFDSGIGWNIENKVAEVFIPSAEYYPQDAVEPQDMELHLVHELTHLHIAPMPIAREDRNNKDVEFAVEAMAEAVVNLRRAVVHA